MMNIMFMMELRPRKDRKWKIKAILINSWPPQPPGRRYCPLKSHLKFKVKICPKPGTVRVKCFAVVVVEYLIYVDINV